MTLKDWTVVYPDGTRAIEALSVNIARGEHVALIGANGAGKSSLILSLVGILPASGEASIFGVPVDKAHLGEIREKTGVVFQNPDDQLFMPTIYDDIAFGPRNLGLDEETVKHRVEDRLELLGISHLRDKTALKLSGGEKRMAAMATVLAMKPDVMLFDEPTAFLDPKARRALINVLSKLPHTMLIATHDLSFALEVCPKSIILKEGRLFAEGPSKDLLFDAGLMDDAGVEAIPQTPTLNA
ncbi:MAG: energy-coupling factor ABC transporter ATP-binding protein [Lachnospiraceae bacterium]|nr:energy-coupling factor ABC transporter ATP-binding protein [Lachnospiraceae bacterium]